MNKFEPNVRIIPHARARRIIARRHANGLITITVPARLPQSEWEPIAHRLIEELCSKQSLDREPLYHEGMTLECGQFTLRFTDHSESGRDIIARRYGYDITVAKHTSLQWSDPVVEKSTSQLLIQIAKNLAPFVLIPEAQQLADHHGVEVTEWNIGYGHKTLGTCRADGRITLSAINVFLPPHLREYVVCHELAHRSEMNHSPLFHKTLNYFLCGREAQLVKELRRFKWPVIR